MAKSKEELREQRAAERDEVEAIQSSFHLNLDDAFDKVMRKAAGVPDQQRTGRAMLNDRGRSEEGTENHHIDWDNSFLKRLGRNPGRQSLASRYAPQENTISIALTNRAMEKFNPVMEALDGFRFASAEEKREEQMAEVVAAVKETIRKMAVREVVNNTRAYYKNTLKFFQTEKGVKAIFKIANVNVTVLAEGHFCGDELICCEQDGTNVTGYVVRDADDGFEDITGGYNIKLDISK